MAIGSWRLGRRGFLASLSAGVAGLAAQATPLTANDNEGIAQPSPRPGSARRPATYTYKTVGNLEIKADIFRPDDASRRPVLLWIHGGGLIRGYRMDINPRIKTSFLNAGYAIVSIDYRLAPETKLPQIIDDLRDAYTWLHDKGPRLFNVDTNRIAVAGDSAGGYLTLMTGFCVKPRPAVLVSLWGYGDITGDWYTKPSTFYRGKYPLIAKDDAWKLVSGPPLTNRSFSDQGSRRFYLYCRQQGLWTTNVSGFDLRTTDRSLTPYCPARNVTKEYPPTLLIHGTDDTDVPHDQSVQMDKELTRTGVAHRFISAPHAGHDLRGGDPKQVAAAYAAALQFVEGQIKAS
jgi:acetyl esterase/lipase